MNTGLGSWGATDGCNGAEGGLLKFFMAVRSAPARCPTNPSSATTHILDPDGPGGAVTNSFFCDTFGNMLFLAYVKAASVNPALVNAVPQSPSTGFSSVNLNSVGVFASAGDTLEFYCTTSLHSRIIHFKTPASAALNAIANTGSQVTNTPALWKTDITLMPDHTGVLPLATSAGFTGSTGGFTNFPFYLGGANHWGIAGGGTRWECDDHPNE